MKALENTVKELIATNDELSQELNNLIHDQLRAIFPESPEFEEGFEQALDYILEKIKEKVSAQNSESIIKAAQEVVKSLEAAAKENAIITSMNEKQKGMLFEKEEEAIQYNNFLKAVELFREIVSKILKAATDNISTK